MDLVGKILGNRYEIVEKIGVGGMATVYKAKCKLLNRNVAIKVLKDEFANDSEFIKRFQVEAQSAASLSHPNIVSIYDVGNEENLHYIVMELIDGKTLKEIINEKGKLPWKEAANIASQIASGLMKAHSNHIVHRDIKPHNIIITKDGVAKVTDFGIAKAVSNSTINAFGSTVGSVHYFSPEHARGGYTDEKSDIYSLGVVLYEMVTGKLPFDGDTPVSVALKHIQETPVEPIEVNKEIPIGINNIIMKAMAKDISTRYQTASELHNDLEKILRNPAESTEAVVRIKAQNEFPTQRIPIVGVQNTNENKYDLKEEVEEKDMKKGITKTQAIVRLVLIIILGIALFFGAFKLGTFALSKLLGENKVVTVPMLVGDEQEEARRKLEELGLKMEIRSSIESDLPEGYVVKQYYNEGYELKEGATVEVTLSKGGKVVLVPDVTKSTIDAAKIQIEQKGLVFEMVEEFSNDVPSGDIVRQEPKVNEEVAAGSKVTVYVSKGLESGLVVVPNVIGDKEDVAVKAIRDAKLVAEVTTVKDTSKDDGVVVSQSPDPDALRAELETVILVVNKLDDDSTNKEDENNTSNTPIVSGKRAINVNLSNKGERETFTVKVTLQSAAIGTRVEYEGTHSREDGTITIDVSDIPGAYLKLYIDGKFDSEQVL